MSMRSAEWECIAGVCPVVLFDGMDPNCPACGGRGAWDVSDEAESQAEYDKAMDEYGIALCLDEIQGRADLLVKTFDEHPKSFIIEYLTAIIAAAERLRL